jgi:hypothetical protein
MKYLKNLLQGFPFYPVLLSVYPVLFLWVTNFVQVSAFVIQRSLIISITITLIVSLVCLALARDIQKAALLTGLALVLFFFYGQFFSLIDNRIILGFNIGRHRFILSLCGILFAISTILIIRTKSDLRNLTATFNLVGIFLLGFTLAQLGLLIANDPSTVSYEPSNMLSAMPQASLKAVETNTPDVYYFLLDGYDRQDLMEQDIHLDNQTFLSDLQNLGFYIPDCTQSNYTTTVTSMAATLNMTYIDQLGVPNSDIAHMKLNNYTALLRPSLLNNQVMRQFRELGYKIITLKTAFSFINFPNSDIVYDYESSSSPLNKLEAYNFEYTFLKTTMMRVLIEATEYDPEKFQNFPTSLMEWINPIFKRDNKVVNRVFQQNLYELSVLDSIANVPGNKFVYAHLLVTHPPFTFTPNGELRMDIKDIESKKGYADQIIYVNKRMITIIKNILANSKTPPIIIIQGDHGHAINKLKSEETFRILNVYYLPQSGKDKLYPTITPVNTFRLIFSNFFNKDYPLLPDQSIWINPRFPGDSKIAPQTCVH